MGKLPALIIASSELILLANEPRVFDEVSEGSNDKYLKERLMSKWLMEGADKATGQKRKILVTAATYEEAVDEANKRDLLVSGAIDTSNREEIKTPPTISSDDDALTPNYPDILKGNATLRAFAIVLQILGVIGFLAWVLISIISSNPAIYVVAVSHAAVCFIWASVLKMFASAAMAVRDIAQNSFNK